MPVQEAIPLSEAIGNGVSKSFALGFPCEKKEYLIVKVGDVQTSEWSLSNNTVTFTTAPELNAFIQFKRETKIERTTDYATYNDSLRGDVLNYDFDRIWWKIQELGVADWLLGLKIQKIRDDVKLTALENTLEEAKQIRDETADSVIEVQGNVAQSQTLLENTTAQANLAQGYASSANSANAAAQQAVIDVSTAEADVYSALSAQQIAVNNSLTAIAGGHKAYQTLVLAQAAQASLPANTVVEVTNDPTTSNNGSYQWNGTSLTKSHYDPLTQAKADATTKANAAEANAKVYTRSLIQEKNLFNGIYAKNYISGADNSSLFLSSGSGNNPGAKTAFIYVKPNTTYIVRKSEQTDMFRIALFKNKFGNSPTKSRYIVKDTPNTGDFEFTTAGDERLLALTISNVIPAEKDIEVFERSGQNRWLEQSKNIQQSDYMLDIAPNLDANNVLQSYFDLAGGVIMHVNVEPNTTYTVSKEPSSRFQIFELAPAVLSNGQNGLLNSLILDNASATSASITTSSNAILLWIYLSNQGEKPFVQVEKGSAQTSWVTNGFKELTISSQYPVANKSPFLLLNPSDLDITAKLKSAFLQAQNNIVYLNAGTYIFNETLTIPTNATFIGVGKVKLKLAPIHNLSFVSWRGANIRVLVKSDETSENITLKNIEVEGADTQDLERMHWGLCMQGYNHRLEDVNVKKINWIGGDNAEVRPGGDGWGLVFYKAKKGRVIGGIFEGSGYENVGTDNAEDITFDSIYCGKGWRTSFQVHRKCKNIKLINPTIEQTKTSDSQTHAALTIHGSSSEPVMGVEIIGGSISAEVGLNTGKLNGAIQTVGGHEHLVTIRGVTINTNKDAISSSSDDAGVVQDWIVQGNRITAGNRSVTILGKNAIVSGNIINAKNNTIFAGPDATTCVAVDNIFTPIP